MNNNTLMIAAAGSGKTTLLARKALGIKSDSVLITTYTESNEQEIRSKIIQMKGYLPSNITVQTWFSFLLQHGVRPYQSMMDAGLHEKNIGFYLTPDRSGKKFNEHGEAVMVNGHPLFWSEEYFYRYYFTSSLKLYSDKLSKFVFSCNRKMGNEIISRISRIYDHVFVDEVQDLAGFDLELLKLLFKTNSSVLLVGDPRQVTYLTHHSAKYQKYTNGNIKEFVKNELGKKILCEIDEKSLNESHRNNGTICQYSASLYPHLPVPLACKCNVCRKDVSDHEGVYLVRKKDVDRYLAKYEPVQLRWNSKSKCNESHPVRNMGESKGATMERVLIYPTELMVKWIRDHTVELKDEARAKFYVALTRAKRSSAIVMNFEDDEVIVGAQKFISDDFSG